MIKLCFLNPFKFTWEKCREGIWLKWWWEGMVIMLSQREVILKHTLGTAGVVINWQYILQDRARKTQRNSSKEYTWQNLPSNNLLILGSILAEAPCSKHPQTTEQAGPDLFLHCSPLPTLVLFQHGTLIYQWMMWCTPAAGRHWDTKCPWSFESINPSIPTLK